MSHNAVALLASFILVACIGPLLVAADMPAKSGIDPSNFDMAVAPGQDFFEHVNGNWIKRNPIPPDQSRWGSFSELHERDLNELKQILDELGMSAAPLDEDRRKLRDFYSTAMDEAKLQKERSTPLKGEFERIEALTGADDLAPLLAHFHSMGLRPLFGFGVSQDEKNSTQYIVKLSQGGLSGLAQVVFRRLIPALITA